MTETPADSTPDDPKSADSEPDTTAVAQPASVRARRRAVRRAGPPVGEPSDPAPGGVITEPALATPAAGSAQPVAVAEPPAGKRPWLRLAGFAVAGVVLLALVASTAVLGYLTHRADSRDAERAEFVQAARQTALNLTTIHVATAKQDVERILDSSTGEFRTEFDGRIEPFVSVVEQAKVNTDGEVVESGLERQEGDSADVLVAARSMVTNGDNKEPKPRDFRLRVTVTKEDGRLLTSKVEFVT